MNVYDTANQLEREIRSLPEYTNLKASFAEVRENEAANTLFNEFQQMQQSLQAKQQQGIQFTEEDTNTAQELAIRVDAEPLLKKLMEQEQAFSIIINDINRVLMAPVSEMYSAEQE
jgi:cell fate (sporulation/competence/biofilm development) regulator YlbF (YheA/YmcA/DUF963 family)